MTNGTKKSWSDILDAIKDAAVDLSSLEVITLTGDMSVVIDQKGELKNLNEVHSEIEAGKVQVVATTRIDFDADTTNFIIREEFEGKDTLLDLHEKSKTAALESRKAALDFVFSMTKNLV